MTHPSERSYSDLANGFHLRSREGVPANHDQLLQSSNIWEVLWGIQLSARSGDFSGLARIPDLLSLRADFLFRKAACELVGYAGSWRLINQFFKAFEREIDDPETQYFLAIPLATSCGLWAVDPLLTLHASAVDDEARYQIERHLSYLLEQENDFVWYGAQEETVVPDSEDADVKTIVDYESYAKDVRAVRDEVLQSIASTEEPVYEGRPIDLDATATTLYKRLTSKDDATGRIYREQMILEASTGFDLSAFYQDGKLHRLHAAAAMEDLLDSGSLDRFDPGQRYFFGHPIVN